jgi:hypothetical protein
MTYKFQIWKPNTKKLTAKQKPFDVCAPVADKDRFVPLNQQNMDMITRCATEIENEFKAHAERYKDNKKLFSEIPVIMMVRLGDMMIVTDQQRTPVDEHIYKDIMVPWDSRFFTTPRGAWDPVRKMYGITEGQHRILALRDLIRLGKMDGIDPSKWEDVQIPVQITKLEIKDNVVDYGPERRVFNIENGEKLPVSDIDKFKNEVHGKNMDSPNKETYEGFEYAAAVYADMIANGITPVGKDKKQLSKAGAFSYIKFVRTDNKNGKPNLNRKQLAKIYTRHNRYSLHEPVAPVEMLPVLELDSEIENHNWYDKKDKTKVAEAEQFRRNLNAAVHSVWHGWAAYSTFAQNVWSRRCKKLKVKESTPADWSLALLIQLVEQAGYTYPGIDKEWYSKYTQTKSGWDCLTKTEQSLFL